MTAIPLVPKVFARRDVAYAFRIFTHCVIGHPVEFAGRFWIPKAIRFRQGIGAARGFDFNVDRGRMTLADRHTARYESSKGEMVTYKPFLGIIRPFACD